MLFTRNTSCNSHGILNQNDIYWYASIRRICVHMFKVVIHLISVRHLCWVMPTWCTRWGGFGDGKRGSGWGGGLSSGVWVGGVVVLWGWCGAALARGAGTPLLQATGGCSRGRAAGGTGFTRLWKKWKVRHTHLLTHNSEHFQLYNILKSGHTDIRHLNDNHCVVFFWRHIKNLNAAVTPTQREYMERDRAICGTWAWSSIWLNMADQRL